jgi:acyl-coenzyme A thioesterase PaaI-like protein
MNSAADQALLEQATEQAKALTTLLAPGGQHTCSNAWRDGSYFKDPSLYADRGYLIGHCNPVAPPMTLDWDGHKSIGTVALSTLHEGIPGVAHGGVIAACFDQILGHALICSDKPGVTGTLSIKYRQFCRIGVTLQFTGWLHQDTGRTFVAKARCQDGDDLLATAEALFVRIDRERIEGFLG